jgi:signal transduction histidine kinase
MTEKLHTRALPERPRRISAPRAADQVDGVPRSVHRMPAWEPVLCPSCEGPGRKARARYSTAGHGSAREERLATATMRLARRNEALEEFAALVAHELKSPLQAALAADEASNSILQVLELVDSLLEAAHEPRERTYSSAAVSLDEVLLDLGAVDVEVTAEATASLPLPPTSLRVILRNLLRNAVAAGASHVHVATVQAAGSWWLVIDDDGVGLEAVGEYRAGSGLGLSLCQRIAARYDGVLELAPRATAGTRATLRLPGVS